MRAVSHPDNSGCRHQPTKCHRDVPSSTSLQVETLGTWLLLAKEGSTAMPKAALPVGASKHGRNTATGCCTPATRPCHTGPSTCGASPGVCNTAKT